MLHTITYQELLNKITKEDDRIKLIIENDDECKNLLSFLERNTNLKWNAGERPTGYTPKWMPGRILITSDKRISCGIMPPSAVLCNKESSFYRCKNDEIFPSQEALMKFIGDI